MLVRRRAARANNTPASALPEVASVATADWPPAIDRTSKLFIGGKQARPDSGYTRNVYDPRERLIGQVGEGNRKDIRNAVEAAHKAGGWSVGTTHNRAQILYYIAENLSVREDEFARRIVAQTARIQSGCSGRSAGEHLAAL